MSISRRLQNNKELVKVASAYISLVMLTGNVSRLLFGDSRPFRTDKPPNSSVS